MGLDLSPQALAELAPQYAVSIPQPVSTVHVISLGRRLFIGFSLLWKPVMLELQDVSNKWQWNAYFNCYNNTRKNRRTGF
jgi:hypothetical protein